MSQFEKNEMMVKLADLLDKTAVPKVTPGKLNRLPAKIRKERGDAPDWGSTPGTSDKVTHDPSKTKGTPDPETETASAT